MAPKGIGVRQSFLQWALRAQCEYNIDEQKTNFSESPSDSTSRETTPESDDDNENDENDNDEENENEEENFPECSQDLVRSGCFLTTKSG